MKLFGYFATAFCAFLVHHAVAEPVRIAIEPNYPPFSYVDNSNKPMGFDVDIALMACKKMQVECQVVLQDWDGLIPGLLAKKFDFVSASVVVTPERLKVVGFSNRYYRTHLSLAVPKDSDIASTSPEQLKGRLVGTLSASAMSAYAEKYYTPAGATVKLYPTQDEANSDLVTGRLDAVISDVFPMMAWLKTKGADCCQLLGNIEGTGDDVAFVVRKEDNDLRERLNQAIDAMRKDGSYQKLSEQYFGTDIY